MEKGQVVFDGGLGDETVRRAPDGQAVPAKVKIHPRGGLMGIPRVFEIKEPLTAQILDKQAEFHLVCGSLEDFGINQPPCFFLINMADICGATRFEFNSRHHQAAREGKTTGRIGPLKIAARAPDGVIEGLELPGHPFFVAVQWHPENLVKTHAPSQNLLRAFIDHCARARV